MLKFLANIDQVAALVQLGITSAEKIASLIREGKAEIRTAAGALVSPEEIHALVEEVITAAGVAGGEAAGRVADRHPDE